MGKTSGKKSLMGSSQSEKGQYLGDYVISSQKFENLAKYFREFHTSAFKHANDKQKNEKINRLLYELIAKTQPPCFLLPAVLDYIEQINALKIVEAYAFLHFELWLNQFSHLSWEENFEIRAKISGKIVPRDAYQTLFPIGMGKTYPGPHFVTAHSSPDLDTTVASFWGWMDAFAARVAEGMHIWNVPGGPPSGHIEMGLLFNQIFGEGIFNALTKTRISLSLSGIELMTQKGFVRKQTHETTMMIDHEKMQDAIVIVDDKGHYLGDWRNFDLESVRQVIILLNNCLRWFESHLHAKLISLFAKEKLSLKDLSSFIREIFQIKLKDCEPAQAFTEKQRDHFQKYLTKVLKVEKGLDASLEEFAKALKGLSLFEFQRFVDLVESLPKSSLFDKKTGLLIENRPQIFHTLEKLIKALDDAIQSVRSFVERLEIALSIKTHVFDYVPKYISFRADVDEIKSKMNYSYLSVVSADEEGKLIPWGIIRAEDLHRYPLGTVSLRDFCNREETKIPTFLEVISVMDHHKSNLQTTSTPLAIIADSQSTNVLCAELAFAINDNYGTAGMNKEQVERQIAALTKDLAPSQHKRLMQRLLQKQLVIQEKKSFSIDPRREFIEYLHFFYGILDDTDLLTKVSQRDIECVARLINRLKTIMLQEEVEVISLDDISHGPDFAQKAAERILKNRDVFSLYRKIYLAKEKALDESIVLAAKGRPCSFFADTKEQNGCCRVGQTKLFSRNYPVLSKHLDALRKSWYKNVCDFYHERPEVDLHLQMISTIASAEDLFTGKQEEHKHADELWIWIPFTDQAIEHLKEFLNAFSSSPQIRNNKLSVELYGDKAKRYEQIFEESFLPVVKKSFPGKGMLPIAVLKYKAGTINSRKAMISPYLPNLVE